MSIAYVIVACVPLAHIQGHLRAHWTVHIYHQPPASNSYWILPNGFLWLQECYSPQLEVVMSSGGGWSARSGNLTTRVALAQVTSQKLVR